MLRSESRQKKRRSQAQRSVTVHPERAQPRALQAPQASHLEAHAAAATRPSVKIDPGFTPHDGDAVVGPSPGIPLTVQGKVTVAGLATRAKTVGRGLEVTVQLGSMDWPNPASIIGQPDADGNGTWTFSYSGVTPVGGPISITVDATLTYSTPDLTGSQSLTAMMAPHAARNGGGNGDGGRPPPLKQVVVDSKTHNVVPATAPVVISPLDGEAFPGTPTGCTVTAIGTIGAGGIVVLWNVDSSTDPGRNGSTTADSTGHWSTPIQVPLGLHTLTFKTNIANAPEVPVHVQVALPADIFDTSPLSYLRALVEFGTWPFDSNGKARVLTGETQASLSQGEIDATFYQPTVDVLDPHNFAGANENVRKARICVEVLRKYLADNPPSAAQQQALASAEAAYRQATYLSLLTQFGTSYNEIRLARTYDRHNGNDLKTLQALADRLGITFSAPPDQIDLLFFDITKSPGFSRAISENAIESIFGLVDTTRDPFSAGVTIGDVQNQVRRWTLSGLDYTTTDDDGTVNLTIARPKVSITLGPTTLATGTMDSNGNAILFPAAKSRVSGWVEIQYKADASNIKLGVSSRILKWRRDATRAMWKGQDFQAKEGPAINDPQGQIVRWSLSGFDPLGRSSPFSSGFAYVNLQKPVRQGSIQVGVYSDSARTQLVATGNATQANAVVTLAQSNASGVAGTIALNYKADSNSIILPFVLANPPIIDPDLLIPGDFKLPSLSNGFGLYGSRKTQVATWYDAVKKQRESAPTPLQGLNLILSTILRDPQYFPNGAQVADLTNLDKQRQQGVDIAPQLVALALPLSAFNFLLRVSALAQAVQPLLDSEWSDVYSILVEVQKQRSRFSWCSEEYNAGINLGPDFFNSPPVEPGTFSTGVDVNGNPLPDGSIDPHWKIVATPSGPTTASALVTNSASSFPIGQAWMRNNSTSRWISPLADEAGGSPPGTYKYRTAIDVSGYDPASIQLILRVAVDNDLTSIQLNGQDLGVKTSGYTAFKTLRIDGPFRDSVNTLDFIVLNEGTVNNPSGLRVEISLIPTPLLAPLTPWRSDINQRQKWQTKLQGRINQDDAIIEACAASVDATENTTISILKNALIAACTMRRSVTSLYSTGTRAIREGPYFIDHDWMITTLNDRPIQQNAYVSRPANAAWLPDSNTSRWISYSPNENPGPGDPLGNYAYRTTFDLSGYGSGSVQIKLRAAADSSIVDVLLNGQSQKLTASGATSLTSLAISQNFIQGTNTLDVLLNNAGNSPKPSGLRVEFSANSIVPVTSDWLAARLLIDVEEDGLQKTTRLAQAIEMMQGLYFSLRNHEFEQLSPQPDISTWTINPSDPIPTFDSELIWTGSYPNWRSIMLIYLNPETILLPTLRLDSNLPDPHAPWEKTQTFDDFVKNIDSYNPLTLDAALDEANRYLANLNKNYPLTDLPTELQGQTYPYKDPRIIDLAAAASAKFSQMNSYIQKADWFKVAFLWEAWYFVPIFIAMELEKVGQYEAAIDWFRTVYAYDFPLTPAGGQLSDLNRRIFPGLAFETLPSPFHLPQSDYLEAPSWMVDSSNPHQIVLTRACPYTRFTLLSIVQCLIKYADAQFGTGVEEAISTARTLYVNALDLLDEIPQVLPSDPVSESSPLISVIRQHAEANILKIRSGRDIAGNITTPLESTQVSSTSIQPSAYRYSFLIERAKQLVAMAQQVEASYLSSLEKADSEAYTALRAGQDLEAANATVNLEALKVVEANDGVALAQEQTQRAQIQSNHYNDLLTSDIITLEQAAIGLQSLEAGLQVGASLLYTAAGIQSGFSFAGLFTSGSNATQSAAQVLESLAGAAGTGASIANAQASMEEKQKDWQFQRDLADQDVIIGQQQVTIANDNVSIASQDLANAKLQVQHANATVDFLANKFTNSELYRWMSGILGSVYAYFLRQATATAIVAEGQLAFERQKAPISVIRQDYWQPPSTTKGSSAGSAQTTSKGGLTGAEQLLEDITRLDEYAITTDQRKLQLTKLVSLAQLDPFAFQQFMGTGVLRFRTPMEIFDNDFPGEYLRLIKQVKLSVIALVPPTQGIRATLANPGISRVVISDQEYGFEVTTVRRDPQLIALSSPANSNGLFNLTDAQSGMLLPFENLGVDTSWEFVMPRAANPIDYSGIADVLLTVEYTALDSPDFRKQIIQQLDMSFGGDRGYSFRQQFADAWYDLNNSDQSANPMKVQFTTLREDFPANIEDESMQIANVLLYFIVGDGVSLTAQPVATLTLDGTDSNGNRSVVSGGQASAIDGVISTRRGNAGAWKGMLGMKPTGTWTLDLSNPDMSGLFKNEQIKDVLFVVSYTGNRPPWPS